MSEIVKIDECRSCGSKRLVPIISLGNQYIVNFVNSKEEGFQCPLDLILCEDCKLLQLKHNAPSESMWDEQYWYKSGINQLIKDDLKDIVHNSEKLVDLQEEDIVVDIGCNDGTLLDFYEKGKNIKLVGFEPSKNVAQEAESKGHTIIKNFFNVESFREKFAGKKVKIITAISMFYDLENPNEFLKDVNEILDKNGLFVIQQNYLVKMLENNAFDNVCHEHREYYSLYSLKNLLKKHNFEIFDVELNEINGGSIRTYIKKRDGEIKNIQEGASKRIKELEDLEKRMELDTKKPYFDFVLRIESIKNQLLELIDSEIEKGKTFCALGASTRGNVLLQYFGLGEDKIKCIFDKNPDKEGKRAVGSWIPVTSPDNIDKYNPDYQIVLIWHIFKGVGEDEKSFVKKGGKFILPLPELKIIEYSPEFDKLMVKKFY